MPRDAEQILLDRLLVKAAIAKIPLKDLLSQADISVITTIQKKITDKMKADDKDVKNNKFPGLGAILQRLIKSLTEKEFSKKIRAQFKEHGPFSQPEALELVHPKDPQLVLPVIESIISDLLEKLNQRTSPATPETLAFLEAALTKVREVDEKQSRNLLRQLPLIQELSKERIRSDMKPLVDRISKITVTSQELTLWCEAVLWIEGHFLREHNKAIAKYGKDLKFKPEDSEVVMPIDDEDETIFRGKGVLIWEGTGITKHFINSHFHAVAVLLLMKIKKDLGLTFEVTDVFPTSFVKEAAPSIGLVETLEKQEKENERRSEGEKKKNKESEKLEQKKSAQKTEKKREKRSERAPHLTLFSSPQLDVVPQLRAMPTHTITRKENGCVVTIALPADVSSDNVEAALQAFYKVFAGESLLREKLIKIREAEDLLSSMISAFRDYPVTPKADTILHDYVTNMQKHIKDHYTNSKMAGWKPTRRAIGGAAKYQLEVDDMFRKINQMDTETGKKQTVLQVLEHIKELRTLADDKDSATLAPTLVGMVGRLCDHLITNLDGIEEEKVSSFATNLGKKQ